MIFFFLNEERHIEDHENIMAILNTWAPHSNNKLLFRKDSYKYHFFAHTSVSLCFLFLEVILALWMWMKLVLLILGSLRICDINSNENIKHNKLVLWLCKITALHAANFVVHFSKVLREWNFLMLHLV